jgi:hypothetical protein
MLRQGAVAGLACDGGMMAALALVHDIWVTGLAGLPSRVGYRPSRIVRKRSSPKVTQFVEALGDENHPQDEEDD